jgi:hypothetical protein
MQSFLPYRWQYELQSNPDTKLFFWNLHPLNLVPSLMPFLFLTGLPTTYWCIYRFVSLFYPVFLPRQKKYAKLLLAKNAISFMDDPNYETTIKYLYLERKRPVDFLPIPATSYIHTGTIRTISDVKKLRFCWIGRLCDFKSYTLPIQ